MNYKTFWNSLVAFLGTGVTYLMGGWDSTLKILAVLMIVDYITGLMKGYKNKNLASDIGTYGLMKKGAIFLVVILAYQIDLTLAVGNPIFRTMAVLFYTANEGISVTENIALLGVPLPPGIVDALKKLKTDNKTNVG